MAEAFIWSRVLGINHQTTALPTDPRGKMVDAVGRSMHDAIGVQSMPKVYPEYA